MSDSAEKRSRIAIVTTVHPWGDPRVFERNACAAVEWGLEVHAFVPANGELELPEWARSERFHFHALPLPRNRFSRFLLSFVALTAVLRSGRFGLVHFHDPELIPAMILLRMLRPRVKVLYDVHEELPLEVYCKPYIPRPFKPLASWFASGLWWLAAHSFHSFAPATEPIAGYWPPARTRVVRNYPKAVFHLPKNGVPDPDRVVFTGGLAEIRGIRELLMATNNLRSEFGSLRLELYGRIMDAELAPLIESAVRETWCLHTPWLSQNELAQRLCGAGVGVTPYHPVPSFLEGLPTKMFEYMALGIPTLTSDFPLWKQIVASSESGICVQPTVAGLQHGLRSMISDRTKLQHWSENGRRAYKKHYRWEVESSNLRWLYETNGLALSS